MGQKTMPEIIRSDKFVEWTPAAVAGHLESVIDFASGRKDPSQHQFAQEQARRRLRSVLLPNLDHFISRMVRRRHTYCLNEPFLLMELKGVEDERGMEYADAETLLYFVENDLEQLTAAINARRLKVQLVFLIKQTKEGFEILAQWEHEVHQPAAIRYLGKIEQKL